MRVRAILVCALAALACGDGEAENRTAARSASAADQRAARGTVVFVGTSLTAGYGLERDEAFPARIAERIDSAGLPFRVVNAGQSGETSAGALRRISWVLEREPADVIVLETGANDALRGLNVDSTQANIQRTIDIIRERRPNAAIVLVQMLAPPNLGPRYFRDFREMYVELARENDLALTPFFLEGVAGIRAMNLADGIHPTAEGHRLAASTIWPTLAPVLDSVARQRRSR